MQNQIPDVEKKHNQEKTVRVPGKFCRPTVDGSEIPKQPPDMYETL